ncbi:hypothetical protein GOV08_02715 [Candidatus Woesearchaeota archaeon]|nr:hypothetical protein [Candidatus Woesearchaeota archaeon]
MGLGAIQKEILRIVQGQAKEKISEATSIADEIRGKTATKVEEQKEKYAKETEDFMKQLKELIESSAKFEVKKQELISKKEIISKVFKKTEELIDSLDDKTLEELTSILLKDAKKQIDVKYVFCNEKTKKWIPTGITAKTQPMLGGLIAENSDQTLRVDNSFETIIEEVRKDALREIVKGLF